MYVKVSLDGAPYLRKIDLKVYQSYEELLQALENMFKVCIGKREKTVFPGHHIFQVYISDKLYAFVIYLHLFSRLH